MRFIKFYDSFHPEYWCAHFQDRRNGDRFQLDIECPRGMDADVAERVWEVANVEMGKMVSANAV